MNLPAHTMSQESMGTPKRVLVVDDERVIREILADFLSMEGFWVRTAEDGSAALIELSKHPYDLVLTDLKMPNMGGMELLSAIQRHTPHVVTVIMTGFGTVETAIDAMKHGAYDYILKPFKVEEVVHVIKRGLEKYHLQKENLRLKEALSLYKVNEAISASLSLEEIVQTLMTAAVHEVDADEAISFLANGEGGFEVRDSQLNPQFTKRGLRFIPNPQTLLERLSTQKHLRLQGPTILELGEHQNASNPPGTQESEAASEPLVPISMMAFPLEVRNEPIGFLCVFSYTKGKLFDEGQRKLLRMITSRAAAAIENAKLYQDLKATFEQTIRGLASAIDKMDRYTAGHSERVALYANRLATRMGLDTHQVNLITQAARMHDIGKIGCVMNLNKPGRLSEQEYDVFKHHPTYGKDILEPISFLHPLIPGVHLHHERWDGKGYPLGLAGSNIPLMARIISVADTYDAMTSDRAYRKALPHEVAMAEIHRCSKSQFDPECTDHFSHLIKDERWEQKENGIWIPPSL